ncbi:MAG TPA: DNA polymerase III subunit delta [Candidatus Nanoarchaeia archaeon]|nr:DNA polymerase III subunit delta [Candidatus Nanoarchaeia archaeon]
MVFFFYGPNSYAARHKLHEMIDTYVQKTGSDMGLERLDGARVSYSDLETALTAAPFLASSRLVIIEGLGANKIVAEKIEQLIKSVPQSTVAVFFESEVDQRTSYFKTLSHQAKAVKFAPLSSLQLANWLKAQVQSNGGTIDRAALDMLIEIVGDDQWRLEQEVMKLINYRSDITAETVKTMVVQAPSQTIFDLVEAMTAGRTKQALVTFRDLLSQKTNELYVLSMIIWQLRNLLLAKTAGDMSAPELSKAAGLSPYVAGKAMTKQREFDEQTLKQAFVAAVETDYAIKTGQGKPDQLIERLIYQLSARD